MTKTMSPTAAQARAKKVIRTRYRAMRLGHRVDSPRVVADRLVTYAQATAEAHPCDESPAYRSWVENQFADRFFELCQQSPVWRRS